MEAIEPIDPDEQRKILLDVVEEEQSRHIRPEDVSRIHYYLTIGIDEYHFEPYPRNYLINVKKKISPKFFSKLELVSVTP